MIVVKKKCCKNASTKKKAEVIKVITRIQLGSGFFLTYFKIIFLQNVIKKII